MIEEPSKPNSGKPIWIKYTKPLEVAETTAIKAYAERNGKNSSIVTANFIKKPNDYTITIQSQYNPQYHAGGDSGLIDGIFGNENWRKGDWQGYQGQDFEAIIDLHNSKKVTSLSARFLQDSRAWILMPTKVEFYTSEDNHNFKLVKTIENKIDAKNTEVQIAAFESSIPETKARYVKIKAYKYGKLPEWHQGFGGDAFIFIDEITIK